MRRWLSYLLLCLGAVSGSPGAVFTNEVSSSLVFAGIGEGKTAVWNITPIANSHDVKITIECRGFTAAQVEGGCVLRIPGQVSSAKPGSPDIPRLARLFEGVDGYRAILTLRGIAPTNIPNISVGAVAGLGNDRDAQGTQCAGLRRQLDCQIYDRNEFWPSEIGRVEEACIGTQNVVRVECFPVQYNHFERTVRFYRRLEGELHFEKRP